MNTYCDFSSEYSSIFWENYEFHAVVGREISATQEAKYIPDKKLLVAAIICPFQVEPGISSYISDLMLFKRYSSVYSRVFQKFSMHQKFSVYFKEFLCTQHFSPQLIRIGQFSLLWSFGAKYFFHWLFIIFLSSVFLILYFSLCYRWVPVTYFSKMTVM